MKKNLLLLLFAFITHTSWGQVLLNENFDYGSSAGDLTAVSGGNWANHSGSTTVGYVTAGLSMTDYPASGVGGAATVTSSNSEDVNRAFTEQTTGIIYFSGLVNLTAPGSDSYFFHLKDGSFGFRGRIGSKDDGSGGILFGIGASSSTLTYGTTPYSINTTYLLVGTYDIGTGESKLYVLTAPQATEPSTPEASNTGSSGTAISSVAIRQNTSSPELTIDGIRVGLSWSDLMTAGSSDPTVSLSVDNTEITEAGGVATVTATLSEAVANDVTVNLAISGTATSTTDYTASASSILITTGNTTGTMLITSVEDATEESNETVIIDIDNITSTATVNEDGVQQSTVTILDNDFAPAELYFSEIADPNDDASARFIEIYNASSSTIDFGTSTWFLARQANGGSLASIQLTGTVAAGATFVVANDSANFNAAFSKFPNMATGVVTGNGDDGYFLYKDGDETSGLLKDAYGVLGEDGTGKAWEYENGHAERKGSVTQSNNVWTASEWTITSPVDASGMNPCAYDPNVVNVVLGVRSIQIAENAGSTFAIATLSQTATSDVTITLGYTGTATITTDYNAGPTIIIPAGNLTDSVQISAIDDSDIEGDESIIIDITAVLNATESGTQQRTVTILDDDVQPSPLFISEVADPQDNFEGRFIEIFNAGTTTIDFNSETWFIAKQSNGGSYDHIQLVGSIAPGQAFTVTEDTAKFFAAYGVNPTMDYSSATTIDGFPISGNGDDAYFLYKDGDETSGTLVDIYGVVDEDGSNMPWEYLDGRAQRNDNILLANRIWTASEWTITRPAGVADMTPGSHNEITVSLGTTNPNVFENGGVSGVFATLSKIHTSDVTVNLSISGTATGSGTDYTAEAMAIVIPAGQLSDTIDFTGVDDGDIETDETIIIDIDNVTNAIEAGSQQVTLTVIDDDTPPAKLFISEVSDPDDNSSARFVEIYNASGATIDFGTDTWFLVRQSNGGSLGNTIQLTGTIADGEAFVIASDSASFNSAYGINPNMDHNTGPSTGFPIGGNGDDGYFLFKDGDHTTGTMADSYGVLDEDGTGNPWEYTDGRAVRKRGITEAKRFWDASEWFITRDAFVANMTPGTHPDVEVSLHLTAVSMNENGGSTKVFASIPETTTNDVTVTLALSGTATGGGVDFMAEALTIVIPAGELSDTISIDAIDDSEFEGDETIIIDIDNVTNGSEFGNQQVTIDLIEDELPPSPLFISEVTDPQDNFRGRFVEIYNASANPIDFNTETWYLVKQTNGGNYDHIQLSGTINPGAAFTITEDSAQFEGFYGLFPNMAYNSTLDLDGTPVSGNGDDAYFLYKDGNQTTGSLKDIYGVVDEDGTGKAWEYSDGRAERIHTINQANPVWDAAEWIITRPAVLADMTPGIHNESLVSLTVQDGNINENGGVGLVIAHLSIPNTQDVTVNLAFSGTATGGGVDFMASASAIVVPAGSLSDTVFITANDDSDEEGDEDILVDIDNVVNGFELGTQQVGLVIKDDDDSTPPEVVLSSTITSPTAQSPIFVNVDFNEQVFNFTATGVTVSNGTVEEFYKLDDSTFVLGVVPFDPGTVSVIIPTGVAQDFAGNDNNASNTFSIEFTPPAKPSDVIAYTSFEVARTSGNRYTDLGDPNTPHDLNNNFDEQPVNFEQTGGELGFYAFYEPVAGLSGGVTEGDFIGVSSFTGTVGAYTNGVQGYQLQDTDGKIILEFDEVNLSNEPSPEVSIDIFVQSTSWEDADTLKVWAEDFAGNQITVFMGVGSEIDAIEGSWATFKADLSSLPEAFLHISLVSDSGSESVYFDNITFKNNVAGTPPSVAITAPASANANGFTATFEFSEDVTGFEITDITVGNGAASNFVAVDGNTYTASITPDGNGDVTLDVAAAVAQDADATDNTAASQVTVTYDNTAPTVQIQNAPSIVNSTATFSVTFEFSEDVTGFEVADITVGNGAASNFVAVDGNTYTADITPDGNGDVTLDVAAAVAQDAATNDNTAATQVTVTYDATAPTVAIQGAPAVSNATAFSVTFEFSEDVTGFDMADITVGNGAASNFVAVDGNTYTADITPDGNGTTTIDVAAAVAADAAGNDNTAATQVSVTFDGTAPTVEIQNTPSAVNSTTPFSATFEFSEDVSGFEMSDITLANATASNFTTVDANTYRADITPDGNGNITIDVAAAVAADAAGNDNTAATQATVTFDDVAPTVTIALANGADPEATQTFGITVTFSEVMNGFEMTDMTITNGTASNMQTTDNQNYTFDITTTTFGNNVSIVIGAGVATDAAGNGNEGGNLSNLVTSLEDDLAKTGVGVFSYDNIITVQFANAKSSEATVSIFAANGQLVKQFKNSGDVERKVQMPQTGIYIVHVENHQGLTIQKVFIK